MVKHLLYRDKKYKFKSYLLIYIKEYIDVTDVSLILFSTKSELAWLINLIIARYAGFNEL